MGKKLLRLLFGGSLLAAAIFCYARWCEPLWIQIEQVEIASNKISKNVTVAAFGDTHIGFFENEEQLRAAVSAINGQNPDAVLFLGDLFDDYEKYNGDPQTVAKLLAQLKAPVKLAVVGNHDVGGGAENAYPQLMEDAGFGVLRNEAMLTEEINFVGADEMLFYHPETEGILSQSRYNLVISHEPDHAARAGKFDLFVAGHTHGGQIALPFYGALVKVPGGRDYTAGRYETENGTIYVNRGLGVTHWPLRFFSRPEITIFHFRPSAA